MSISARWRTRIASWVVGAVGVPIAYTVLHDPVSGLPPALGCGGALPQPIGVVSIYVPAQTTQSQPVPVGRDAFFAISLGTNGIDADAALAATLVEVRGPSGPVAGTTRLLPRQYGALVGFEAAGELTVGTALEVTVSATNSSQTVRSAATLVVSESTAMLSSPAMEFGAWTTVVRDVGERVACASVGAGGCGFSNYTFGRETEVLHTSVLSGSLPNSPVATAWQFRLSSVSGSGQLVPSEVVIGEVFGPTSTSNLSVGLDFERAGSEDLCVLLSAVDLKTGGALESEICSTPAQSLPTRSADSISVCTTVPPEFNERLCRARGGMVSTAGAGGACAFSGAGFGGMPPNTASGAGGMPPNTASGSGGMPPNTASGSGGMPPNTAAGAGGAPPSGGADPDDGNGEGGSADDSDEGASVLTEGCGCKVGAKRPSALGLAMLAALATAMRVRRGRQGKSPTRER